MIANNPAGPKKSSSLLKLKRGVMKNINVVYIPREYTKLPITSLVWFVLREWLQKIENTFFFSSFFFFSSMRLHAGLAGRGSKQSQFH